MGLASIVLAFLPAIVQGVQRLLPANSWQSKAIGAAGGLVGGMAHAETLSPSGGGALKQEAAVTAAQTAAQDRAETFRLLLTNTITMIFAWRDYFTSPRQG